MSYIGRRQLVVVSGQGKARFPDIAGIIVHHEPSRLGALGVMLLEIDRTTQIVFTTSTTRVAWDPENRFRIDTFGEKKEAEDLVREAREAIVKEAKTNPKIREYVEKHPGLGIALE